MLHSQMLWLQSAEEILQISSFKFGVLSMTDADLWTAGSTPQACLAGLKSRAFLVTCICKRWRQSAAWGISLVILVRIIRWFKIWDFAHAVAGFSFKDPENVVQVNYVAFVDEIKRSIEHRPTSVTPYGMKSGWSAERPRGKCQVLVFRNFLTIRLI